LLLRSCFICIFVRLRDSVARVEALESLTIAEVDAPPARLPFSSMSRLATRLRLIAEIEPNESEWRIEPQARSGVIALARSFFHPIGQRYPRLERQVVPQILAHVGRKNLEAFEADLLNDDRIFGTDFRWCLGAANKKGGSKNRTRPMFDMRFPYQLLPTAYHLVRRARASSLPQLGSPCRAAS